MSDSGTVLLWSLLGVGYYLLAVAAYAGVMYLVSKVYSSLAGALWVGVVVVPVFAFLCALMWLDSERQDERKGLGIALALFYGLSCLIPIVICGGMILSESHGHH